MRAPIGSKETTKLAESIIAPSSDINARATDRDLPDLADPRAPERSCLVTRQASARASMLRFVVAPDRSLVFDAPATLPGRGLWLSARRDVIQEALKRRVFQRAAGRLLNIPALTVPDDLADRVVIALRDRLMASLGLARRAGQAIGGFEKAREALAAGRCAVLVGAADGSVAERGRVLQGRDVPVLDLLDAATLGAVFGRDAIVHVALAPGRLAEMILADATRLRGVLPGQGVAPGVQSGQRDAG
jgi:predicted RNA-binding protein YlxR (DUF448 family)